MRTIFLVKRLRLALILGIGAVTFTILSANPTPLSQDEALAEARGYILAADEGAQPDALVDYEQVSLDPKTWGRSYYAFRGPEYQNSD
jgi:hypothetical protein